MRPNDADWMANSVDPNETAPLVWSGSALFAQAYLSENYPYISIKYPPLSVAL